MRLLDALEAADCEARLHAPGNPPARRLEEARRRDGQSLAGGVLWEQVVLPWRARGAFLVSFTNTAPLLRRRQLAVVHDAAVFAVPDNYSWAFRTWYRVALRILLRRAGTVVTDSAFSQQQLAHYCGVAPSRLTVVHCGSDHLDALQPDASILDRLRLKGERFILAVGTTSRAKNLAVLLEALGRHEARGVRLVVAGGMEARVFNDNRIPWPSWVTPAGHVTDAELKALYGAALCFVFPSRYEGFGLPPLEAMRCGCPTVVSTAASLPEVCGDAPLYFDPDDAGTLAAHLANLMEDAALRERLREQGRRQAGRYTWDRTAARYRELIEAAA